MEGDCKPTHSKPLSLTGCYRGHSAAGRRPELCQEKFCLVAMPKPGWVEVAHLHISFQGSTSRSSYYLWWVVFRSFWALDILRPGSGLGNFFATWQQLGALEQSRL